MVGAGKALSRPDAGGAITKRKQDVLFGMVVSKRDKQKEAPKKYQEKVFGESKELEEQKGKISSGTRATEAYARKEGRRKGKSENVAKIGRIEGDKTLALNTNGRGVLEVFQKDEGQGGDRV